MLALGKNGPDIKMKGRKVIKINRKKTTKEQDDIIELLEQVQKDIDNVYSKFEYVTDEYLIDSYVYELKALQMRYQYLLKLAKQLLAEDISI